MKRILILLLAIVLVLTLLAGCKSSEPAPASSEAPASSSGGEASGGEKSSGSEPAPSQSSAPEKEPESSVPAESSESAPAIDREADYTRQFENVILNIAFISEEGYRVTIPSENPTPDSSEESSDLLGAPPTCCVYRGEEIALNFYFTGHMALNQPGLPTTYEQRFARAELNGTLIDQGEKDVFDYFFYERPEPLDESIITYCYMGTFKEFPTYGFTAYSATREEAEKQFAGMTIWLTDAEG